MDKQTKTPAAIESRRTGEVQTRAVENAASIEGYDASTRTLTLSFASDVPYRGEVLQMTPEAVDLTRLNDGVGALLFNHDHNKMLGHVRRAWIDGNKARAEVYIDDDEDGAWALKKLEGGSLRAVSVGYVVHEYVYVEEGKTFDGYAGECWVATKWEALEISLVSVPADASVGVGRSYKHVTVLEEHREEGTMEVKEKDMAQAVTPETVDTEAVRAEVAAKVREEERARVADITALCREFDADPTPHVQSGATVDAVRAAILEKLAGERKATTATVEVVEHEADKLRDAITDGMMLRAGMAVEKAAEGAQEFRGLGLRGVMVDVLEREGVSGAHRMEADDLIRSALTSTSALPGILGNVAKKSMLRGYNEAGTTFEAITSKGTTTDFKAAKVYDLSAAGALVQVKENGEFLHDEITEKEVTKSVLTYGRAFSLTRQMIINDDMGALTRLPRLYAQAARRGINELVYRTLANDKNYKVGTNKPTTGTADLTDLKAIQEAVAMMAARTDLDGKTPLNITPKYLVVPKRLEFAARQLVQSPAAPKGINSGTFNPCQGMFEVVADPMLDAINADAWYLVADPAIYDGIEVTYLNGNEAPTLESQLSFDRLGIDYRIYIDYGVTMLDNRALYMNPGK